MIPPRLGYRERLPSLRLRVLACILTLSILGRASPVHFGHPELLSKRDNQSIPPSVWTPTVVIFVVFVGLATIGCLGRAFLRHSRATQIANANANANGVDTSVLTADQLAGAINHDVAGGGRRPRRHRRPRRTPSQMSVTSLPEYKKDPGEQELVIFRGQSPDQEGAHTDSISMPQPAATVVVDRLSDDEDTRVHQTGRGDARHSGRYFPMPTSPNTMPLLQEQEQEDSPVTGRGRDGDSERGSNGGDQDDNSGDLSMQMQLLTNERPSTSTTTSTIRPSPHLRSASTPNTIPSPPGSAPRHPPAYFEVIGDDEPLSRHAYPYYPPPSSSSIVLSSPASSTNASGALLLVPSTSRLTSASASTTALIPEAARTSANRNRQSGLRTFLNRMSISIPGGSSSGNVRGSVHMHQRSASNISANTNASTRPSSSSFFHRPGSSLSSSSHSLAITQSRQTISQTQSHSRAQSRTSLTSPSLHSLGSISAPLTHTASRTKFTFPQSRSTGRPTMMMTPEQVRVIAGKEAIGRFGVPYGPDAEAFAAESGAPPPGFEDVVLGTRMVAEADGSGWRERSAEQDVEEGGDEGDGDRACGQPSASSIATGRVEPRGSGSGMKDGHEGEDALRKAEDEAQTQARSSQLQDSILEPKLKSKALLDALPSNPSTSSATSFSPHSNGIRTSPPPSPSTATPILVSEFGQILPSQPQPLSTGTTIIIDNNIPRSEPLSPSSIHSFRTYATAAESLSASFPSSSSSSLSLIVGGVGAAGVGQGWSLSSSEEGVGEGERLVDEHELRTPT